MAQHSCQLLLENVSFLRRFGLPRSEADYANAWNKLSEAEQVTKWTSITDALQVMSSRLWATIIVAQSTNLLLMKVLPFVPDLLLQLSQGRRTCQAHVEVHELLSPLFRKADAALPQTSANVSSKVSFPGKPMPSLSLAHKGAVAAWCCAEAELLMQQSILCQSLQCACFMVTHTAAQTDMCSTVTGHSCQLRLHGSKPQQLHLRALKLCVSYACAA